ncbi:MAG: AMP-binding protein [Pseudomonadota bacterium]
MSSKRALDPTIAQRLDDFIALYFDEQACAADLLCDRHAPSRLAFRIIDETLEANTLHYGDLKTKSEQFAAALSELGVVPGDRVATLMGKSQDFLVVLLGIWRLGAVHVPLFTAFAPPAISFRLIGSRSKIVVADAAQASKLNPSADMPADGGWTMITRGEAGPGQYNLKALISAQDAGYPAFKAGADAPLIEIYTSGTTGTPKGVIVPVKGLASFHAYMEFGLDVRESDVFWCAADPGWAYGLYYAILGPLATGCDCVLLAAGFSPELTFGTMAKYGVTNFAAAPTVYRALKASGIDIPKEIRLRVASSAGEPLTPDVNVWAEAELGVRVHDHYGQSETGMTVNNHHHRVLQQVVKTGSMGMSMPGWQAGILKSDADEEAATGDVGRLAISLSDSPLAWFSGYSDNPEKTSEKFTPDKQWYVTGDVAFRDEDGFFHFSSRDDDVIIMAGYRIGPFEVESTLSKHPAVLESAAVARPDEVRGEVLEAFVRLNEAYSPSDALTEELQNFVKQNFAAHAFPRRIHYVDAMPKTPSGKIQRFILRQRLIDL